MNIKIKDLVKVVSDRAILIALTSLLEAVNKTRRKDGKPLEATDIGIVVIKYIKQMAAELAEAHTDIDFVDRVILDKANIEKEVELTDGNIHK